MRMTLTILSLLFFTSSLQSQFKNYDFIGAGHDYEVTVSTSSNTGNASGQTTVDGFDVKDTDQLKDASRFLAQCTFGADMPTIRMVAAMGKEAWLDEQFQLPMSRTENEYYAHGPLYGDKGEFEGNGFHTRMMFNTALSTIHLSNADILRQRVGFALSQIMVINNNTDFFHDVGLASALYYDMLLGNAFGNYEKLLMDVTLSPSMGTFLSHYGNRKADPVNNINPDENYAREIMQLFSIGLWELNQDGTRKYDNNGQFIPTYNNADIKEFAQVFTGLSDGGPNGTFDKFDNSPNRYEMVANPMKMYDDYHDTSSKVLLKGTVLPAGQTGDQDIAQTIRHLSTHSNTAPFICKSLIKMLTTSNPSPAYVERVANIFNPTQENNMQQVIKAILLDPEARVCQATNEYTFGKLREPYVRLMNYMRAFTMTANRNDDYEYPMECLQNKIGQAPLQAPSVFNFFLPDYSPQGPINQQYMVAPEFQLMNATNAIGQINEVNKNAIMQEYLAAFCPEEDEVDQASEEQLITTEEMYSDYRMDYSELMSHIDNQDDFIDYLDILLANGLMTSHTKATVKNAINQLDEPIDKLRMAIYLILISPDYAILK